MAANLNGTSDIATIALKIIEIANGTVFLSVLIFLVVSGYVVSMLLKSGIMMWF